MVAPMCPGDTINKSFFNVIQALLGLSAREKSMATRHPLSQNRRATAPAGTNLASVISIHSVRRTCGNLVSAPSALPLRNFAKYRSSKLIGLCWSTNRWLCKRARVGVPYSFPWRWRSLRRRRLLNKQRPLQQRSLGPMARLYSRRLLRILRLVHSWCEISRATLSRPETCWKCRYMGFRNSR